MTLAMSANRVTHGGYLALFLHQQGPDPCSPYVACYSCRARTRSGWSEASWS